MLKLTNSFCRYLTITCERVEFNPHVKRYSHLCRIKEIHKATCIDFKFRISQKHSNSKKHPKIRIPCLKVDELTKTDKMSEAEANLATYGGTIVVSSDNDSSSEENAKPRRRSKRVRARQKIPPNFRLWEHECNVDKENTLKFKVVSYNVLSQYLLEAHSYLYSHCAQEDLRWQARSARLYDEIITLAPDILCLQEVQLNHVGTFFAKFEKIGYQGVYKRKTGQRVDGCAIYFKKSVFKLIDKLDVEFNQPNLPLLNRDNIGLLVKLAPRQAPSHPIVVVTTHLLFNPKRSDVRLAQMQLLLAEIDRFAFYGAESGHLPIILTGDFNSNPSSEVLKLLNDGHVSTKSVRDNSDWEQIGITDNCQHLSVYLDRRKGQQTDYSQLKINNTTCSGLAPKFLDPDKVSPPGPFRLLFNSGDLWQNLQLSSVYNRCLSDSGYEVTTFQKRWVTVDYMFFSKQRNLRVANRLRLPSAQECEVLRGLPNEVFGSDHLALAAVFEIVLPDEDSDE